jgi:hypothetical protein
VWSRPEKGAIVARLDRTDTNGYPTTLAILGAITHGCTAAWYRVQLSVSPNGRIGWVRPWALFTFAVHTRIVVQLSRRRLIAYRYGRKVLTTSVAVGRTDAPTPVGRFFVDGRFVLTRSNGPFGAAVLSVSAHSDAPVGWPRGRQIALHGTNDPGSIGQAASHGCVRLRNDVMRRLFALAPAGSPVLITT